MTTETEWTTDPLSPGEQAAAANASGQRLHNNAPSVPAPLTRVENGPVAQSVKYLPPPGLHPKNVELIEGIEGHEGYVRSAIDAFGHIHGALQRLSDAREKLRGDSSRTDANKVLLLAVEAEKLQTAATLKFDTARKNLTDGIAGIEQMLNGPLVDKANNQISGEIRSYLRALPDDKRAVAINKAIEQKDVTVLQACLGAPPMLSGLSPELQAHYTRKYRELTAPEQATRLRVMRDALELVEQRAGLVLTETEKALGARWNVVQKLRKTSSATEQALLLINNPVQP
jgi:hypothetical protein